MSLALGDEVTHGGGPKRAGEHLLRWTDATGVRANAGAKSDRVALLAVRGYPGLRERCGERLTWL